MEPRHLQRRPSPDRSLEILERVAPWLVFAILVAAAVLLVPLSLS